MVKNARPRFISATFLLPLQREGAAMFTFPIVAVRKVIDRGTKSPWLILLDQFKDVMVVILFIAALVSLFLAEYADVVVIMAIVVLNAAIGFSQESVGDGVVGGTGRC